VGHGERSRGIGHPSGPRRVVQQPLDCRRDGRRTLDGKPLAGDTRFYELRESTDLRHRDRRPGGVRLRRYQAERLVDRGHDRHV
jgi:hypothetical protein